MRYGHFSTKIEKAAGAADRSRQFVVSTGAADRDGDTINPSGFDLTNFLKNPVILFAHDYGSLPIGRATDVRVRGDALVATVTFADHPFAQQVLDLIDGGFLNATSVGFKPTDGSPNATGGTNFTAVELLEISVVPVPANPQALAVRAFSKTVKAWADDFMAKRGRVLSQTNTDHITAAEAAALECASRCRSVLDNASPDDVAVEIDDDDKSIAIELDDEIADLATRIGDRVGRTVAAAWDRADITIRKHDGLDLDPSTHYERRSAAAWRDYRGKTRHDEIDISPDQLRELIAETLTESLPRMVIDASTNVIRAARGKIID